MSKFQIFVLFLSFFMFHQCIQAQSPNKIAYDLAMKAEGLSGKEAVSSLDSSLLLCRQNVCADSTLAKIYHRLGVAYFQGYIDDSLAIRYTDTSIIYYTKYLPTNHILISNQWFNHGVMNKLLGNMNQANQSLNNSIKIIESLNIFDEEVKVDSILQKRYYTSSDVKKRLGELSGALNMANKSLKKATIQWPAPHIYRSESLAQIGDIYFEKMEFDKALLYFELSISERISLNEKSLIFPGILATKIASSFSELGYFRDARREFLSSISILNKYSSSNWVKRHLALAYRNLMWLNILTSNWNKADSLYQLSLETYRSVLPNDNYPEIAAIHLQKGEVEHRQGNYSEAIKYCDLAQSIIAPLTSNGIQNNSFIGSTRNTIEILSFRARVLQSMNRWQEALEQYELLNDFVTQTRRSYQANLSKYFLIQKVQPAYEQAIIVCRQLYEQTGDAAYLERAYAFNARHKAILLLEGLQSERAMQFAGLPQSVLEQEATLRDAVTAQETILYQAYQKGESTDSLELVLFEQQQVYYDFIEQLEQEYPAYYELKYATNEPPAIAELQAALEPDRALLEYFVGEDSIYTFRITRDDFRIFAQPKPAAFADDIELLRELLVNGIAEDCEQQFIQLAHQFYQLLLAKPLASLPAEYTRLLFVPDGLLNFIAFESLLYQAVERLRGVQGYVLERYACSYAYSSKLLLDDNLPRSKAQRKFAGFGLEYDDHTLRYLQELELGKYELELDSTDVQHPCGIEDTTRYLGKLNFSDDEVRNISRLFRGDTWLNEEVTKPTFLENASGYQFLHLAMHGSYDLDYPMNSSLIFTRKDSTDIFLRAAEIYGMQFDSDLVVLSACNTAYGKLSPGEGMMTLARAFHYAGIPSAVASLWSIPDRSASEIMYLFYQELDKGLPKDVALRNAKLTYLADDQLSSPSTRQPVHWAPTVVIGSIAPIDAANGLSWWWLVIAIGILAAFTLWRRSN